jgi:phosphonate transport system substrate-binding protein
MQRPSAFSSDLFALSRRHALGIIAGASIGLMPRGIASASERTDAVGEITIGLTPVVLNDDLGLLAALKDYLETATGRPVKLSVKRTYEEITSLLISGQLHAAWICGYPYVSFKDRLDLVAVPVWRGAPFYQSYVIAGANGRAGTFDDLRGSVHAFSDPNSNSGYLVTAALLAERGLRPEGFFSRIFFTYGHRNVVRAVAAGLAESGSVDGYVWEVMAASEPGMIRMTRVIRKSEPLAFPPIAALRGALARPDVQSLQQAFIDMAATPKGKRVLELLQLDGFMQAKPEIFDAIAIKAGLVKRVG